MTLRERLSWHALEQAVVDPRVDRAVMARVAIYLYLSGAVLGVASLLAGGVIDGREGAAAGAIAGALVGAGLVLVRFDRIGPAGFRIVVAAGVILVSFGVWTVGVEASPVWSLYLGIVFYAVYFFERRDAGVTLLLTGVAYAAVSALDSVPWEQWLFTNAVLIAAAVLVMLIKERIQALIARLDEQARTDPLTGLLNRRGFEREVEHELERAARYRHSLALLSADIDDFKELNDIHGHFAGDAALERVARALRDGKRQVDQVARVGGDEFMVLLPETEPAEALILAERLRGAVGRSLRGEPPSLTVSFGVAAYPQDGATLDDLYMASDEALYRAKPGAAASAPENGS